MARSYDTRQSEPRIRPIGQRHSDRRGARFSDWADDLGTLTVLPARHIRREA